MEESALESIVDHVLAQKNLPEAAEPGKDYVRLVLKEAMGLAEALTLVKTTQSVQEVLEFNLGKEATLGLLPPGMHRIFTDYTEWSPVPDDCDFSALEFIDLSGDTPAYVWLEATELKDASETRVALEGGLSDKISEIIKRVLKDGEQPEGGEVGREYDRLSLKDDITLIEALQRVKNAPSVHDLMVLNLGSDAVTALAKTPDLLKLFEQHTLWIVQSGDVNSGSGQFLDMSGWTDAWVWIEATETLDPDETLVALGDRKECEAPRVIDESGVNPVTCPASSDSNLRYAARYQPIPVDTDDEEDDDDDDEEEQVVYGTMPTVDEGIKPGDILLTHHPIDDDIARMTLSWVTHAGIAVSENWAIDADKPLRLAPDPKPRNTRAVQPLPMAGGPVDDVQAGFFFNYGGVGLHPNGGVVYRYVGDGKTSEKKLDRIRQEAAAWAFDQTEKDYAFVLRGSHLVKHSGRRTSVVDKKFDDKGKGLDDEGETIAFTKDVRGKKETWHTHPIYCAELVWRAFYSARGTYLVNPKELDLLRDKKQGIPSMILQNLDEVESRKGWLKVLKRMPRGVAMKTAELVLRGMAVNKFYFCAPGQLASNPKVRRVAQFEASEDDKKEIDFIDFRDAKLNPGKLAQKKLAVDEDKISKKETDRAKHEIQREEIDAIQLAARANEHSTIEKQLNQYMSGDDWSVEAQQLMGINKLGLDEATRQVREKKRKALKKEYWDEVKVKLEAAKSSDPSKEECVEKSWDLFLKDCGAKKIKLSVLKLWADAEEDKGPELIFGEVAGETFNSPVDNTGFGMEPFSDSSDF